MFVTDEEMDSLMEEAERLLEAIADYFKGKGITLKRTDPLHRALFDLYRNDLVHRPDLEHHWTN